MSSTLTTEQLASLRAKLEAKRDELRRKSEQHLRAAIDDGGDALVETGDIAEREHEVADAVGLAEHERALLAEVEHALEKLARGKYGASEKSGRPIPYARLDAVPWARLEADEAE